MATKTATVDKKLVMRLRGMVTGMVLVFFLGLTMMTFADDDTRSHGLFLGLHIILGIGLLIGALLLLRAKQRRGLAIWGLIGIVGAFTGGIMHINDAAPELGTFIMATGFMLAFLVYGWWLSRAA